MTSDVPLPAIPEEIRVRKSIMPFLRQYLSEYLIKQKDSMTAEEIKTIANDAAELRTRFHHLCEEIELSYWVELLPLPKDNWVLVLSEYPLTAESAAQEGGSEMPAELSEHQFQQHTFIADGNVKDAMWGAFTILTSFVHYELPPRWRRLLPKWKPKMRVCPVLFVSSSDGQCEAAEREFRRTRLMPNVKEVFESVKAYQVSMLPELMDDVQMLTEQLDRSERDKERYKKERDYDVKKEVDYLLSKRERGVAVSRDKGLRVSLFSSRAIRYLFYILALFGLLIIIYWLGTLILTVFSSGGGGVTTTPTTGGPP
jgi:hypothetical protein